MNSFIHAVSSSGWTESLAQSLLHSLWQATLIGLVFLLLQKNIAPSKSAIRCRAGLFSLLAILLCWLGTLSILNQSQQQSTQPIPVEQASPTVVKQKPSVSVEQAQRSPVAPAIESVPNEQIETVHQIVVQPELSTTSVKTRPLAYSKETVFIVGWSIGVIVMTFRLFFALAVTGRHRRKAVLIQEPDLLARFQNLGALQGIKKKIRFAVTHTLKNPGVIGIIKPMVLIPVSMMTGLPPADLEAVVAHELAHIRRRDYLFNLLQMIVETLFFFNPAVWWISHRIRMEREACCDAAAIQLTGRKLEYAQVLLRAFGPATAPAVAFSTGKKADAKERLLRIVQPHRKMDVRIGSLRLLFLLVLTAASLVALAKTGELAVQTITKIMTPKERIEKLQELAKRDQPEDNYVHYVEENESKITISGQFILPEGDMAPDVIRYSVYSGNLEYGFNANKDLTFSGEIPESPNINIFAYAEGYAPFYSETFHSGNGQAIDNLRLELEHGFTTSVQVVDPAGDPLPNIEVEWFWAVTRNDGWSSLNEAVKKTTDSNGTVSVENSSEHPVKISISALGFQPLEHQDFTLEKDHPLIITLKKGLTQKFKVIAQSTGQPISGAEIFQRSKRNSTVNKGYGNEGLLLGATDKNGTITLDTLEDDTVYGLTVKADGYNPFSMDDFSATNKMINICLENESIIRGTIIGDLSRLQDRYIDEKFQRAVTYYTSGRKDGNQIPSFSHVAPIEIKDGVGHFIIRGLNDDEVTICPAGTQKKVTLSIDSSQEKEVTINIDDDLPVWEGASRIVEFTFITPEGFSKANGNCSVWHQTKEAKENGDTSWRVEEFSVSNGAGRISIPTPGYIRLSEVQGLAGYWMETESFEEAQERLIESGDTPFSIRYTLNSSSGGIIGKLLNSSGNPMGEMSLSITSIFTIPPFKNENPTPEEIRKRNEVSEEKSTIDDIISDHGKRSQNGTFSYTALPLNYTYKIIAHSDYTFLISELVTITDEDPIQEITLQCNPLQSIRGTLSMPDGSPCANIRVDFGCNILEGGQTCSSYGLFGVTTDANGGFVFERLNPHPDLHYTLSIDPGDGWQPFSAEVEPGDVLNYTLQKGLPLKGRVIDQKTKLPLAGVSVGLIKIADLILELDTGPVINTDSNGYFSCSTLSPEPYLLGVYAHTNLYTVTSPKPTNEFPETFAVFSNMFTTITGGVDEYIELTVQATNFPSFQP
ncbi:MAG: M48 family metalloprotease [Pontiellaceae bacterium]|nr:M48 family metalloprotease [Pontiellaceae bacterium]